MTNQANDVRQTVPMVDQMIDNLDAADVTENVKAFTADAGYFSEENMAAVDDNARIDAAYIATGRQKHSDAEPDSPKGPRRSIYGEAKDGSPQPDEERAQRVFAAEGDHRTGPVFSQHSGQIKAGLGFRNFLLRSLEKMQGEWNLICLTHNLLKLFRSGAQIAN